MSAFAKNLMNWMGNRVAGAPAAAPTPPAPVTPPQPDQQGLLDAAAARRRRLTAQGTAPMFNGTLLTGPQGLAAPATTAKPSLLGQ